MNSRQSHIQRVDILDTGALAGLRILIIEDEFLIAMDVEQLCRDHGARDAIIFANVGELGPDPLATIDFDVAIIDVMVGGGPTLGLARQLKSRRIPFIFATGYSDREDIFQEFAGVRVVGKPYTGTDIVEAIVASVAQLK